ncbi:MAG TPA: YicC/YloC family endoribonuclease [Bryobacteraceae bacterium]|jgi:uncharacterized protein (TIGR00255 family)
MPIRSMTGFARVSRSLPSGELTLTIKTVNHRGLDLHFHMPMDFDAIEPALRAAIRKRVVRGHAQIMVSFKRAASPAGDSSFAINEAMLQGWFSAFRAAAAQLGLQGQQPDLNEALRLPGMVETRAGSSEPDAALDAETLAVAAEALEELDRFRLREGTAIDTELRARIASIQDLVKRMEEIRSRALPYFQKRLQDRLGEMLGGTHLDPARLAQEAAILAERSDISEELVRLKTHADQTGALISAEGETGKKLDFLLQEMNREANTILSKTGGLGDQGLVLTDLGLAAKAEIDRIREQSLNIE